VKLRLNRRWKYSYLLAVLLCVLAGCGGDWSSGDRVLVAKFLYDTGLDRPRRYDVVVFRYPRRPLENGTPKNYIKRLLGLPGELLAIFFGNLYRCRVPVEYDDPKVDPNDLWQRDLGMHENDPEARKLFKAGQFEILRKPPDTILAMRRLVYDNDHPAKDLVNDPRFERWAPDKDSGWAADNNRGFAHTGKSQQVDWLRYRHVHRESKGRRQLITDFLGYNAVAKNAPDRPPQEWDAPREYQPSQHNWVGDLILECELKVEKAAGEFCMELSRGMDRFQACWQLDTGTCTLYRLGKDGKQAELKSKTTGLKGPGTYQVRFANVDDRLTVWVNRELPFGDGVDYAVNYMRPVNERGPQANDLQPASVGSKGATVEVRHLKLWRDVYYTQDGASPDARHGNLAEVDWSEPKTWGPLRELDFKTYYVQPRHYFCLGDNSAYSADSREWGLVPERLMLGRALMVYYPFNRAGAIE
jgi:signal peptidase I